MAQASPDFEGHQRDLGMAAHQCSRPDKYKARARSYAAARPEIGTLSNCSGCHRSAECGQFED
ncbi:MAG: hypothetical protein L3J37_04290 [Rhodobacteraceae bacterium]|nr:hypothetical protein [Paracoccaceae bacterium]